MTKEKQQSHPQIPSVPVPDPDYGILRLYSIRDKRQPRSFPPFDSLNDGVAMRHFYGMIQQPGSIFALSPSDFELWCVGEFVQAKGLILVKDGCSEYICTAHDIIDNS